MTCTKNLNFYANGLSLTYLVKHSINPPSSSQRTEHSLMYYAKESINTELRQITKIAQTFQHTGCLDINCTEMSRLSPKKA